MSNIIVVPNIKSNIDKILNKDIKGMIIGVKDLSIYSIELNIDEIIDIADKTNKQIIIAINKMIHNRDLDYVKEVLNKVKASNISGILFYDVSIIKLAKELNINKELIISQEHLNASINSNNFYYNNGVTSSLITSDITFNEILEIKKNSKLNIYYTTYGYLPIFYSRRKLLTNYFKYINKDMNDYKYYIINNDLKYMIIEKEYGTVIYSPIVNMLSKINELSKLDNLVIDLSYIDDISIIDKYLNRKSEKGYLGFYETKTIFKLKEEKK